MAKQVTRKLRVKKRPAPISPTEVQDTFDAGQQDRLDLGSMVQKHYLVDAATLLKMAKDRPDFLFPDLVPASAILMMVGKPGVKKSWVAYSLLLALVQNKPWFGVEPAPSKKKTRTALVLNFDNPAFELGRRFKRLGLQPTDSIYFHSVGLDMPPADLPPLLLLPLCIEPITALVFSLQPDLILIDSMRQAHTGDEASSEDMGRLMSCFRQLTHWGASVLVLHHTRKTPIDGTDDSVDNTRGSSAIAAAADGILVVDENRIKWSKTRLWQPMKSEHKFMVVDSDDNRTRVDTSESQAERVLKLIKDGGEIGLTRAALAAQAGLPPDILGPLVQQLTTLGCITSVRARVDGKQMRVLTHVRDLGETVF